MARALTLRQMATAFARQAVIQERIAKLQLAAARAYVHPTVATVESYNEEMQLYDKAIRSVYQAESFQVQADEYLRLADEQEPEAARLR